MSDPLDHDAAFDAIVGNWDVAPSQPVPSWPVEEDVDPNARVADVPEPLVRAEPEAYVDPEEHFVPPPAPPAPKFAPETWFGILAIAGGLMTVFFLPFFGVIERTRFRDRAGVIAVLAGLGLLVWRMRDTPHDDDDGAIV